MTDTILPSQTRSDIVRFVKSNIRDYALLLSLLVIMIFFQFTTNGTLFKPVNMTNLILQNSYIVIMALGMLLIIVAGHIDLSVGSVSGFVGAVAAVMMVPWKMDPFVTMLACLALGAAIGGAQGYFVAYHRIPAFIVTLAGMLIFKGLALTVLGGASVGPFPREFQLLSSGYVPDVFNFTFMGGPFNLLALIIGAVGHCHDHLFQHQGTPGAAGPWPGGRAAHHLPRPQRAHCRGVPRLHLPDGALQGPAQRADRHVRAHCAVRVPDDAHHLRPKGLCHGRQLTRRRQLSGINTERMTLMIFVIMGALAALAGLVFAARLNVATPKAGAGFELEVIAACFIGGAAVTGGVGKIIGAVIGAFIIGVMNNGMSIMGIGIDYQFVIKGAVLMLAVFLDVYYKNKAA